MCLCRVKIVYVLCSDFLDTIYGLCSESERIDFVFDTYMDDSVKDSERGRRSCSPVDLNEVHAGT